MEDSDPLLVSGVIIFEEDTKRFSDGTAFIKLLDIGKQDTSAEVISTQTIQNIRYDPEYNSTIPFSLKGNLIRSKFATYTVSVLIDLDGDGQTSLGDFITMENYHVLKNTLPDKVTVKVKEVI